MSKRSDFIRWINSRLVYLDGATGSNLIKNGMSAGACPEKWMLANKEILISLQKAYVENGSDIIYAPTFTANRIKLAEYGLADQVEKINRELVALSRQACGPNTLIAGDLSMTGVQLKPVGQYELEDLINVYKEQIVCLDQAGVDCLVVETMMSLQECRAALIAAKEVSDLPVLCSLTFEANGRTLYGTDAKTAAIVLEHLGAVAIGANCSSGPDQMISVISDMAEVSHIPIIAKPNAGLPFRNEAGETCYDMDEASFAAGMKQLVEAGASVLGGCCGTTPAYIKALYHMTNQQKPQIHTGHGLHCLASERSHLIFSLEDGFHIVGERINPTGKKKLQAELREQKLDMVLSYAEEQERDGAEILDINMGMSGINEKQMMCRVLEEVSGITSLPLSIDTSSVEVMEAALRQYPGRALINSISLEKIKIENLLPLAAKYGAMFILLPLSDKGLPKSPEEKIEIIEEITNRAIQYGLQKEDIIVDGLVTTVGANKNAALETLHTIRYCKENGYATTCGLSNISFGLPARQSVNTAFLTLAIREGLTMAIANPSQELLVSAAFATDLLMHKTGADLRYIDKMTQYEEQRKQREAAYIPIPQEQPASTDCQNKKEITAEKILDKPQQLTKKDQIRAAVLKGNRSNILTYVKEALEQNEQPKTILDEALLPAINEVGILFDKGKYFLPQLIASAETMKTAIEYLEPLMLKEGNTEKLPVVVIATVEGDIHDIGKNLVALMLKNYGFRVIDLGKDVPKELIIQKAIEEKAAIIALSALMTTTMQEMREVIRYAREQKVTARIMIGGAVITQDYADEIEADGYSRDAAEAVRVAQKMVQSMNGRS